MCRVYRRVCREVASVTETADGHWKVNGEEDEEGTQDVSHTPRLGMEINRKDALELPSRWTARIASLSMCLLKSKAILAPCSRAFCIVPNDRPRYSCRERNPFDASFKFSWRTILVCRKEAPDS